MEVNSLALGLFDDGLEDMLADRGGVLGCSSRGAEWRALRLPPQVVEHPSSGRVEADHVFGNIKRLNYELRVLGIRIAPTAQLYVQLATGFLFLNASLVVGEHAH